LLRDDQRMFICKIAHRVTGSAVSEFVAAGGPDVVHTRLHGMHKVSWRANWRVHLLPFFSFSRDRMSRIVDLCMRDCFLKACIIAQTLCFDCSHGNRGGWKRRASASRASSKKYRCFQCCERRLHRLTRSSMMQSSVQEKSHTKDTTRTATMATHTATHTATVTDNYDRRKLMPMVSAIWPVAACSCHLYMQRWLSTHRAECTHDHAHASTHAHARTHTHTSQHALLALATLYCPLASTLDYKTPHTLQHELVHARHTNSTGTDVYFMRSHGGFKALYTSHCRQSNALCVTCLLARNSSDL
jgi:hypothetical protein